MYKELINKMNEFPDAKQKKVIFAIWAWLNFVTSSFFAIIKDISKPGHVINAKVSCDKEMENKQTKMSYAFRSLILNEKYFILFGYVIISL